MPPRTNGGQSWYRIPHNWELDDTLVGLPDTAQLLFLKIIGLCDATGSEGVVTGAQLLHLTAKGARGRRAVERLLCSGALSVVGPLSPGCPSDATPMSVRCSSVVTSVLAGCGSVVISMPARWLSVANQPAPISAGQNKNRAPKKPPHAGGRLETDRQTDREEGRTPSGSVRPSSAPAAPRVAGGATQPALKDQEQEGVAPEGNGDRVDRSGRAAAIAFARSEVERGRKNNPAATGIDTKFSRYDPDRPIVPINSAFRFDEDPE
jgi:hypothetical protein